jgi:uncharacterized protein
MKKKLIILIFIATALLPGVLLCAQDLMTDRVTDRKTGRIIDNAGLLSATGKTSLEKQIEEIASNFNFNLIILTERSIAGEDAIDYSWNFLDSEGLYGETWDGCLLLQSIRERDYAFTASGRGDKILNSSAYDKLEKDVVACLKQDDYAGAYEVFIRDWEKFLVLESKGRNYNFLYETKAHTIFLVIAWLMALLIGFMAVRTMRAKMNTALPAKGADVYIVPGSMILTKQHDKFLYSTVTKSKRQSSSGGGGSRSGGGRSSRSGKY